jgi:hypothetical protein
MMGHKIVGQQDPWWSGCGQLLAIMLTGAGLILLIVWINYPR